MSNTPRRSRILATAGYLLAASQLTPAAYAANDCAVTVTFTGMAASGPGVEVSFQVTNKSCDASVGRFTYSYETDANPGRAIERAAPSWRGVDGKSFTWTDTIPSGSAKVRNVRVLPASVESTKS